MKTLAAATLLPLAAVACDGLDVEDASAPITLDEIIAAGDRDGDGLPDLIDNCPDHPNPDGFDADADGIGNACDADYDNDGVVGGSDFSIFVTAFGGAYDGRADHVVSDDNAINLLDYAVFVDQFGGPPPESDLIPLSAASAGDTHVTILTERVGGELRHGFLLRPIAAVERFPSDAIDTMVFGRSKLTVLDDGQWLAQGPFPCFDTGVIDPALYSGNTPVFRSDCGAPDLVHISMHVLPLPLESN